MLEEMDSADARAFWKFRNENDQRFDEDRFTWDQYGLACFAAGMNRNKEKQNERVNSVEHKTNT